MSTFRCQAIPNLDRIFPKKNPLDSLAAGGDRWRQANDQNLSREETINFGPSPMERKTSEKGTGALGRIAPVTGLLFQPSRQLVGQEEIVDLVVGHAGKALDIRDRVERNIAMIAIQVCREAEIDLLI